MQALEFTTNPFGGVIVTPEKLPEDPNGFQQRLIHSLETWTSEGFKVVWIEIPIHRSELVPVAVGSGFGFHHTGKDYLMTTLRLVEGAFIPPYATHYVGGGGAVINDRDELLVVSEKHRRRSRPSYKLPGGALRPGEHLVEGVIREVLEETGVRTRFEALACFRHWHGYRYGKSDIYFICRLSPLNHDISKQEAEIEECRWMPVQEYLNSEYVGAFNKRIVQAALQSKGVVPASIEGYTDPEKHEVFMPPELKE